MLKSFLYSKKGLLITGIVFAIFLVLVLPYVSNLTEEMTHTSFSPDTGFFYSIEQFNQAMIQYGQSGRNFYILMRWTFDVIWPLVYFSFFTSVLAQLKNLYYKKLKHIMLLPIIAVLFDFSENIFATINVGLYPEQSAILLRILQVFSLLKWLAILLIFALIIILILFLFIKRHKNSSL